MSEIDLTTLARAAEESNQPPKTKMEELNMALRECKFGKFHIKLYFSALAGYMSGVFISAGPAFLLATAECDLEMTLVQKGFLVAVPYVGMVVSSMMAGMLTDIFGRKIFLSIGLGGIFLSNIVAGTSQTYEVLVTALFFEGLLFAISYNPVVTMSSEYAHPGIRDRVMVFQTAMIPLSMIFMSLFTWPIMLQDWNVPLFGGYIVLHTWNFYIYICSTSSLVGFIMYQFIPESPKYLLSQGRYDEAREVLIKVYTENTGKPAETYAYYDIWKNVAEKEKVLSRRGWRHDLVTGLHAAKPMFRKPLIGTLLLICTMNWLNMLMYNVIRLWYPQLSTIIEHYSQDIPPRDLCTMLDEYTTDISNITTNLEVGECIPKKSGNETYINNVILGIICLIPFIVSGFLVDKVGKKRILILCPAVSCGITVALQWTSSKALLVGLFSAEVALAQLMMGMYQTIVVESFPTAYRTLAVATIMTFGRFGTLLGNVAFPVLLSMGCVVPFSTLAVMMACITLLAFFLPSKKVETK